MLIIKSAIKCLWECPDLYEFTSCKKFKTGVLHTKDVLQKLIYKDNWRQAEAANLVAKELFSM